MAVPSSPSIGSRALYYGYAVPTPVRTVSSQAPNNPTFVSSGIPADITGLGSGPLPATVVSLSGSAPDYSGMRLIVHLPDGTSVVRYAGFQSGQPMLNQATWVSQGSNPAQAYWALQDTTT